MLQTQLQNSFNIRFNLLENKVASSHPNGPYARCNEGFRKGIIKNTFEMAQKPIPKCGVIQKLGTDTQLVSHHPPTLLSFVTSPKGIVRCFPIQTIEYIDGWLANIMTI